MWSSTSAATRHINCGLPPEFFFVAPASSFQHHHPDAATINFDPIGVGVIPLLTATPCLTQPTAADDRGGMQLWQHQQLQNSTGYLKKPITSIDHTNLVHSGGGGGGGGVGGGGGSSSMGAATCQDCGNQAKKDCSHRRCRTCCKSRGYDCATHVKSTWVPAARRRERQLMGVNTPSVSTSGTKKARVGGASQTTTTASHTSTSNTTPPRSFDTNSSHHQDASFKDSLPGQVRAPAVFKCVRVTSLDDGDDEYAYQAVVRIGGHVFKGFLYDQGREGFPNISELHLGGGGAAASQGVNVDPSVDLYGTSGGGLLGGGSNYGNPIN